MIKIDLITGFLGSGKTTFLKKYARYWMEQGQRICILENDFGAINVDMVLLKELLGEQCGLEMIVGGDGEEAHKRRFKTKLIAMAMSGYERVLIEPSGIFDMDEFFDALYDEPLDRWYETGNVIAIADAGLEENLSKESDYVLASEIADAGLIVLSKTQEVAPERIEQTKAHIMAALSAIGCSRNVEDRFLVKNWEEFTREDYARIAGCSYVHGDYRKLPIADTDAYTSLFYFGVRLSKEELLTRVERVFEDSSCGHVFRIKGFVSTNDSGFLQINATREKMEAEKIEETQEVVIVIGEKLEKTKIAEYFPTIDFKELI